MLKVELYPFIFPRTFEHILYTPFVIDRESRVERTEVYLTLSVHVVIKSRRPFHTNTRGKTDIGILELIHKLGRRHRIVTGNNKAGTLHCSSLVRRETDTYIQPVSNFNAMEKIEI